MPPEPARLAELLSLAVADLADGDWRPEAWSCGVPFLGVPLRDRAALARAKLRLDRWEATPADGWAPRPASSGGISFRAWRWAGPAR